ncbi:MAG TPA: tRNA (guanosine(37)-N1)-methyltransferase TrmD [Candidatus Aveggerthella stercoripullorum]|uniref:tRNA (guanine-N(1)-)-methyltransferase n=1 Tax=Candidatus Aveggerthella stercoripullorum TaxID=2840688 RepID=A0A9D1D2V2_9ACTN|nr:tRNA (guanosine(37)-N1)-methyltransferase TrmD [Candidatus Aveggerthella stercoripullorum]
MRIDTISTFPRMFDSVMGASMMRIAQEKGILDFAAHDLRDWTHDRHRTTDDEPYGGGQGLVMKCEPIFEAWEAVAALHPARPCTVFLSPAGEVLSEALVCELAAEERLLFVCGHYEGIDERAYTLADRTVSLGDYVLTSGELASMVVIDAVVRKLDGVLGDEGSAVDESFYDGLLEYPCYTRPSSFRGMDVPSVLLSGNHAAVDAWRREQSILRTARLRPDLLATANLTDEERARLDSLSSEHDASFEGSGAR